MTALYGREYDGLSGPTAAQLTVLAGLHDRVGFTLIRLRETAHPLTGKAACDKLFVSSTSVSAAAVVLDHSACDLIKPGATANVVPHLDPEARVIIEAPNGPVVQTTEGLRRLSMIGKCDDCISYLLLVRRQLKCEKVRLRHDIDGGGTVFAVRKKHGRQREVWHGTKLTQASQPPPRSPCLAGPETFRDIELRLAFSCLLSKRDATCYVDQLSFPRKLAPFLWTTSNHRG